MHAAVRRHLESMSGTLHNPTTRSVYPAIWAARAGRVARPYVQLWAGLDIGVGISTLQGTQREGMGHVRRSSGTCCPTR
jgi:hypothetical protein